MSSSDVMTSIRELAVQAHRGNAAQAESIIQEITGSLNEIRSAPNPDQAGIHRIEQTLYALDEVRTLLAEGDFPGAANAAREAGKEWRQEEVVSAAPRSRQPARRRS